MLAGFGGRGGGALSVVFLVMGHAALGRGTGGFFGSPQLSLFVDGEVRRLGVGVMMLMYM